MAKERVQFVEMHERLRTDADGSYKKELLDQLESYETDLKRQMDAGLPPDQFGPVEGLQKAIVQAKFVVERAWSLSHRSS